MKKFVTASLLLLSVQLYSQSYWSSVYDVYYAVKSYPRAISVYNDSLIIIGGIGDYLSCSYSFILAYYPSGQLKWNYGVGADAVDVDSNFIYCTGYNWGMDDVPGDEYLNFTIFNSHGEQLSYKTYPEDPYEFEIEVALFPRILSVINSSKYLVSSNNKIMKADSSGKVFWIKSPGVEGTIINAEFITEEKLLISTKNQIYVTDSSCAIIHSVDPGYELIRVILKNDTIYSLAQDRILIYDTLLTLISSVELNYILNEVKEIRIKDSLIWIGGVKNENFSFIKCNKNTGSQNIYELEDFGAYHSFAIVNDYMVTLSATSLQQINVNGISIYSYPMDFKYPDVSILDLHVSLADTTDSNLSNYYNADIVIGNLGVDTITSVALYCNLIGGWNCINYQYYNKFEDLSVLPGESDTIQIKKIKHHGGYLNDEFCFEVMAPNSSFEPDIEDNTFCNALSSIDQKYVIMDDLSIFPNPAQNELYINSEIGKFDITIFNALGKKVLIKENSGNEALLDISGFNQGIYTIIISSDSEIKSFKIIKL